MNDQDILKLVYNATLPWDYPTKSKMDRHNPYLNMAIDTQANIMRCLSCTKGECNNCLSPKKKRAASIKQKTQETFLNLIDNGFGIAYICEAMGITERTYWNYKRKYATAIK